MLLTALKGIFWAAHAFVAAASVLNAFGVFDDDD